MTALTRSVTGSRIAVEVPPALQTWVTDRILAPVTFALLVVATGSAALRLAGVAIPLSVQLVPFAVSILVFGLPHGALDHLVPARLRPGTGTWTSIAVVVALYLVVGSATAALWVVAPLAGFLVFIGITWFHWGQGDLYVDRLLDDGASGRLGAAVTVAVRGALPMVLPFVAHPGATLLVIASTTHPDGPVGPDSMPVAGRVAGAVLVLALVVLHLVVVHRSGVAVWRQAIEDVVLVVFFVAVPPVLAVGLYFTLWHSVRHILRLELTDERSAVQLHRGRLLAPFLRFMRQAWPITAIAVAMLVVLAVVLRRADLGVYLALIAALTTPHAVIVSWMDRVQHTWRRRTPTSPGTDPR